MASNNPFQEPVSEAKPTSNQGGPKVFAASTGGPVIEETIDSGSPFTAVANDTADANQENQVIDASNEDLAWQTIFAGLPQAFVVLDEQQNVLFTNKAHVDLLGIDASECEGGMNEWFRRVCDDDDQRGKVVSSWHEHIWRNQLTRTFALEQKGKGLRYIEFRSTLSDDGHMIVMQTDVTDDLASDEALRQANLKFRSVFSNSAGGVVLVNQEGVVHEVNRAFSEFAGVKVGELLGRPFGDLLHTEDRAALEKDEANALAKISDVRRKMRFIFPGQDRAKAALVTPSYILNESQEAVSKVYQLKPRDMQLMAKLKELSSKAQALLDAVPDMFVLIDKEGIVKDWSPPAGVWEEPVALNKDSVGKHARDSWPAFAEFVQSNLKSVFDKGVTIRHILKNGEDGDSSFEYPLTLAPFGNDLALVLVEKPELPGSEEAPAGVGAASKTWYGQFFASTKAAVLVTNAEGEVQDANPSASAMLGQGTSALERANLFQLLSKAPGTEDEFDLDAVKTIETEKTWGNLLSVSASGPKAVIATVAAVKNDDSDIVNYVVMIDPKQEVEVDPLADVRDMAQSQFRSQLQIVTSLFSITPDSEDRVTFNTWLMRLKVLAESMTTKQRVGLVHLLRDVADEVASVSGRGLGLREVVISGSSSLTIENEIATTFALLAGEVMHLGVNSVSEGRGPSMYIDVEAYEGDIILTAKPGEDRSLFTKESRDNARVIEILAEQLRGKISVGVGEDEGQAPSIRLTFPAPQH